MNAQVSILQSVSGWQKGWLIVAPFVFTGVVWSQWNEVGGSVSVIHSRVFVIAWALVGFMMVISVFLKPHWRQLSDRLITANLVALALYLGISIGTTDWANWPLDRWWQAWATVPLLMGVVPLIRDIASSQSD
jgi:hypothetical protein